MFQKKDDVINALKACSMSADSYLFDIHVTA